MIKNKFELDIPVFIISQKELEDILNNAPSCQGDDNKDIYEEGSYDTIEEILSKYKEIVGDK